MRTCFQAIQTKRIPSPMEMGGKMKWKLAVGANFTDYWVYVAGPLAGALLAVGAAFVLRGPGGGRAGSGAAQGALQTEVEHPDKA